MSRDDCLANRRSSSRVRFGIAWSGGTTRRGTCRPDGSRIHEGAFSMRLPKGGLALAIFVSVTSIVNAQWIEAKSANYSIFYQSGYERDAEFTRTWLNRAEDLLKSKYGVAFTGFHISFYLYPTPTKSADVGLANLQCCAKSADGIKTGTI